MVFISLTEDETKVILDCHKHSKDGDYFRLVIDKKTCGLIEKPEMPDMDASAAYSHIYSLIKEGKKLPKETVAEWG